MRHLPVNCFFFFYSEGQSFFLHGQDKDTDSFTWPPVIYIDLARAKSEALFNIYRFLKENIKLSNTKDKMKATRTVKTTKIDLISKKTTLHVQHTFFF